MMADAGIRIFVSYRRTDARGYAGWLSYCLEEEYGRDSVFRDVDSLEPGVPFMDAIEKWIRRSDVVLCLIGDQWASISDPSGHRRLDDPRDPVRAEVATALRRKGKTTIPVLLEGARMPMASELPEEIQALTDLNGHEINDARWRDDFAKLDAFLKKLMREKAKRGRRDTLPGKVIVDRHRAGEESPDYVGVAGGFPPKGKGARLQELLNDGSWERQNFNVQFGGVCSNHQNWGAVSDFVAAIEARKAAQGGNLREWGPHDIEVARQVWSKMSSRARKLLTTLLDAPGPVLWTELAKAIGSDAREDTVYGTFGNPAMLAKQVGRKHPVLSRQTPSGNAYLIEPTVKKVFNEVRRDLVQD
jgi:hypothetical protein